MKSFALPAGMLEMLEAVLTVLTRSLRHEAGSMVLQVPLSCEPLP